MKKELEQNKLYKVKKKVKNFFKKISNPKDVNINQKVEEDEKYLNRENFKMF